MTKRKPPLFLSHSIPIIQCWACHSAVFAMLRAGRLTDHRFDGNGHGGYGSGLGPRPRHWLWQVQLAAHGLELSSGRGFVTAKPRQKFGDHRQNCGYLKNIYIYIIIIYIYIYTYPLITGSALPSSTIITLSI